MLSLVFQQLLSFIRMSKAYLRSHADRDSRNVLRSLNVSQHRLAQYGIKQHVACVVGELYMGQIKGELMNDMLCSIQAGMSVSSKLRVGLTLIQSKLRFSKHAPWS